MSLIALAVRLCTVRALLGSTLAGQNVDDSPDDPVAMASGAVNAPYIAVFTDTENNKPDARSMLEGHHLQDIAFHILIPNQLKLTIDGTPYDFQARSSGAALVIDLIHRQIEKTLMEGEGVWSQLWREFVCTIHEIDARAYVLTVPSSNVRTPARQIIMRVDTIFSPPFGAAPEGIWAKFIAAVTADPDLAELGPLVEGMLTGDLLPQWRQDQAELGLSDEEVSGLGLGPNVACLDASTTDDVVPLIEVDILRDTQDPLQITATTP